LCNRVVHVLTKQKMFSCVLDTANTLKYFEHSF
jgi:hypothetical protein